MPIRVFRDQGGREWRVWDVRPSMTLNRDERRRQERRVARVARAGLPERRRIPDRRRRNPALLTPGLEDGWLCFENPEEKRRLTPIPPSWQEAPDPELEELLEEARAVRRRMATEGLD